MMSAIRKVVLLGVVLGLLGVAGCDFDDLLGRDTPTPSIPDLSKLVPDAWTIEKKVEVDVDGDGEVEWLVIYRYDKSPRGFGGPLGGVIYDRQPNRSPENLAATEPYRPAILVAYHLLPAKGGRGYLGENLGGEETPWPRVATYDVNGDDKSELVILGYSFPGFPTSLAIFRWVDKEKGYEAVIHAEGEDAGVLWGDAGVELKPAFGQGPMKMAIVRSRLYHPYWYLRSQLGRRIVYEWDASQTKLEKKSESIDFVFGRPQGAEDPHRSEDPDLPKYPVTYPEAAVLAYYEDWHVKDIVAVQEDKDQAWVTVNVVVDGQLVQRTCDLTRKPNESVKDVIKWEVSCPE
ncbi:MAG: hypothetical protein H8D43_00375 [Chloroflexi bacterium]|nr:hypothetical protein [Chloroflexota bacterium]